MVKVARQYPEERDCRTFLAWAAAVWPQYEPDLVHIPNERGERTQRRLLAAVGVRAGQPDYMLLVPVAHYHGMVMEAKAAGRGWSAVSQDQRARLNRAEVRGYYACVAAGVDQMIAFADLYLRGEHSRLPRLPFEAARGGTELQVIDGTPSLAKGYL